MEDTDLKDKSKFFQTAYKVYHFVAKVLLYSVLIILILVAIGFAAYFVDLQRNIKNGVNKSPLLSAYIIISPSMVPTIKVEDAIIILRQEPEELEVGDIITFLSSDPRYSGLTITHRIVGIEKSENGDIFFRTKGDNNNTEDTALVSSKNVFGRVILKIPKIGYIQSLLMKSYGWIILVVIPCLGIVIYDIIKLVKSIKGTIKKNAKNEIKQERIDLIETKEDIKREEEEKKLAEEKEKYEEQQRLEKQKGLEQEKQARQEKFEKLKQLTKEKQKNKDNEYKEEKQIQNNVIEEKEEEEEIEIL